MTNGKKRVLLAEDNPGLARVLQFNLQRAGLQVSLQPDGARAWQELQAGEFDAVVTDFDMPGMNGGELCQCMRESEKYADTPIVMVTGREMELDVRQMQAQLGLAAVFSKPYSPKELVSAVERLLNSID